MAGDQTLNVKLTGDDSDLVAATTHASTALDNLKANVDKVDSSSIEIPAKLELDRINRDTANLNKVLDGLERRKANPDVDLDITQLLRDEAKVRKQLDELGRRKVEVEATLDTDVTGFARFSGLVDDLGTNVGNVAPGLGSMLTSVKGLGPAAAAVAVGLGGWKLGEMAGDVETMRLQLDALAGSTEAGAEAFQMLQEFAADTPFTFDEITGAAKSLLAAGKDVGDLPDYLTELGNVAAATGTPIQDLGVIFQQMISKGKISNEELMQLAERGVPAYQALADQLGMTVPEVQKLAENGELGAEQIDKLAASLGNLYPTAIQDQAASFNGKMSTLQDTVTQTGQKLGDLLLPMMSDTVSTLTDLANAASWGAEKLGDLDSGISDITGGPGIVEMVTKGGAIGILNTVTGKLHDIAADADNVGASVGGAVAGAMTGMSESVQAALDGIAEESDAARQRVEEAWAGGIEIRTRVNFLISQDDIADEIRKATTAEGVQLPANLTVKGISGLGEQQKDLVNNLSGFVQAGIEEGSRRAEVNPDFDVAAWNAKVYRQVKALTIKAGIDPSRADAFLKRFLGIDRTVDIGTQVDQGDAARSDHQLDMLSRDRTPFYNPFVDPGKANAADNTLDNLANPRVADIAVNITRTITSIIPRSVGGGSRSATGGATPRLLAGSRALGDDPAYYYGPSSRRPGRHEYNEPPPARELRPAQTPVKVYLDGQEIADHLELRVGRLATSTSLRRRA